jgi:hypothetical protein
VGTAPVCDPGLLVAGLLWQADLGPGRIDPPSRAPSLDQSTDELTRLKELLRGRRPGPRLPQLNELATATANGLDDGGRPWMRHPF